MKIRDFARGHWPRIVTELLGEQYANTRKNQPCPANGEGRDRYRLSDKDGIGSYFCHCSQGEGDGFALLQCAFGCDFATAAAKVESVIGKCPKDEEDRKPKPETWAQRLRRERVKAERSNYLAGRGLEVAPGLHWHPRLAYFDDAGKKVGEWPAMLAPVTRGREFVTYHATYLDGGRKAPVKPCRKILPANGPLDGVACPLYPLAGDTLGIAEGVETAIAAKMLDGLPVWAALNTALLRKWQPPEGIKTVRIYADHDANYAGHAAAYELSHRLAKKDIGVEVVMPDEPGDDFNDILLRQRRSA